MSVVENRWRWRVEGAEVKTGTMEHSYDETGVVESEHVGDALNWLINKGPIWDCLDADERFTITIEPEHSVIDPSGTATKADGTSLYR